jgi:hypothetical protein
VATAREKGANIRRPEVRAGHYGAAYGTFASELYAEIRAEAFSEDIGQQSWLSAEEQHQLIAWLELRPDHRLLYVACGSGGPTMRIAERTGAVLTLVECFVLAGSRGPESSIERP